jgi:hypothetical protein
LSLSDLQTFIAVKQIEKQVDTQDTCLQSLVNSDSLNQTKLTYKIDTGLKNITTSIQKFAEVVVESKPCEMVVVRRKDKEAQMMVAELSPPMVVHVFRRLLVFPLHPIPSSDFPLTCQDDC